MPTATKTRTPSAELAKLVEQRDKLRGALHGIRRERDAHDAGTQALRAEYTAFVHERREDWRDDAGNPKPGTPSAKLREKVRARQEQPNPHQGDFDAAAAEFEQADRAVQEFHREHLLDLIAEREPDVEAVRERFTRAFEELIAAGEQYAEIVDYLRPLIIATPSLDGQATAYDPRPNEWQRFAREALDGELIAPGITEVARWEIEHNG